MRFESRGSSESLVTGLASKGFLSGVGSFMNGEVTLLGIFFITLCAGKGLFSGVYSQMYFERTRASAIPVAVWADSRFLRGGGRIVMGSHMIG